MAAFPALGKSARQERTLKHNITSSSVAKTGEFMEFDAGSKVIRVIANYNG